MKLIHLGEHIVFCTGQPSRRLARTSDASLVTCSRCKKRAAALAAIEYAKAKGLLK